MCSQSPGNANQGTELLAQMTHLLSDCPGEVYRKSIPHESHGPPEPVPHLIHGHVRGGPKAVLR
jgi:hypothetical protein